MLVQTSACNPCATLQTFAATTSSRHGFGKGTQTDEKKLQATSNGLGIMNWATGMHIEQQHAVTKGFEVPGGFDLKSVLAPALF